jgi:hypothetical protein
VRRRQADPVVETPENVAPIQLALGRARVFAKSHNRAVVGTGKIF